MDDPIISSTSASVVSHETKLKSAQDTKTRLQLVYKKLIRETSDLTASSTFELLSADIDMHLTEVVTLQNDFASNSLLINELMDITDPDNADTVANDLFLYSKKISKLKAELVRIRDVRDGYKGTLNMKRMAEQLTSASVLTGPSKQSDLQVLKKYVNTFGSDLLRLNNAVVQSLYDQVVKLAEPLFDRSEQQMLKAAAAYTVTPPDDATSL